LGHGHGVESRAGELQHSGGEVPGTRDRRQDRGGLRSGRIEIGGKRCGPKGIHGVPKSCAARATRMAAKAGTSKTRAVAQDAASLVEDQLVCRNADQLAHALRLLRSLSMAVTK
jgi:hypothetical protein